MQSNSSSSTRGASTFGARYYSSNLGRFLTPDWSAAPEAIPYANLSNPQSLNLYNYTLNNPVTGTDPDGHICIFGIGNTCGHKSKPSAAIAVGVVGGGAITADFTMDGAEIGTIAGPPGAVVGALVGLAAAAVVVHFAQERPGASASSSKGAPKLSPKFVEPTNAPQPPPDKASPAPGHEVRVMGSAPGYPNGYWVETNAHGQPVDPSTGKPSANVTSPESRARTHMPLPPGYSGGN